MKIIRKNTLLYGLTTALLPQAGLTACNQTDGNQPEKPNILFIMTDQQSANMMSCAGNPYLETPNLDRLAEQGIRFTRAYAANPVCVASRFSLLTGRMPSEVGMEDNDGHNNHVPQHILETSLGHLFTNAGYETAYAGKMHLTGSSYENGNENAMAYGFERYLTPNDRAGRDITVNACVDFIQTPRDKPFLLFASLINPHDICYMPLLDWVEAEQRENPFKSREAIELVNEILQIPDGMSRAEFIEQYCPPLPDNFQIPDQELPSFTTVKQDNYIGWSRRNYTEDDWRLYRYLYARLTEVVDQHIGQILHALEEAGLEENTLVVFTSDHGDQDASHQTGLKGFLYEESANIPFIMKWTNVIQGGQVDSKSLVSNGLDLIPTLCDFAGISLPVPFSGLSVRPIAMDEKNVSWREYLVVENNSARLVLFDNTWKYMVDAHTEPFTPHPEMLFNIKDDPGEMHNLSTSSDWLDQLKKGRRLLPEWYRKNNVVLNEAYLAR